jgi:hypothetical protein
MSVSEIDDLIDTFGIVHLSPSRRPRSLARTPRQKRVLKSQQNLASKARRRARETDEERDQRKAREREYNKQRWAARKDTK